MVERLLVRLGTSTEMRAALAFVGDAGERWNRAYGWASRTAVGFAPGSDGATWGRLFDSHHRHQGPGLSLIASRK